eukprot:2308108-Prymnesium_polylepis.1
MFPSPGSGNSSLYMLSTSLKVKNRTARHVRIMLGSCVVSTASGVAFVEISSNSKLSSSSRVGAALATFVRKHVSMQQQALERGTSSVQYLSQQLCIANTTVRQDERVETAKSPRAQ